MEYNKHEVIAKERGYTISEDGIVYNPKNKSVGTSGKNRYKYFSFRINDKIIKVYFHRFQAYNKFGNKIYDEGMVVRHLNGNILDNSIANIEIGTNSDNMMDIPEKIRQKRSSNANKKYPDDIVSLIKSDREKGMSYKELMNKYSILSKGTLSYIINNR